jgi:transcriptional regulator with XRE-family HTH domain
MTGMGKVADPPHTKRVLLGLGKRIRQWREANGLTRPQLAELLEMDGFERLAAYERGQSFMPYYYLIKLSDRSGLPLDYWLRDPEPGPHALRRLKRD